MNSFPVIWITSFLVLTLLCLALGRLVKYKVEESELDLGLLIVTGFALLVILGSITTLTSVTARFTTPIVLLLSLLGLILGFRSMRSLLRSSLDFAFIAISFAIAGLPVLANRKVSWPGWVQLDDTATFLAITNHIMSKGQSVPAQIESTYDRTIQVVLGGSFYGTYDATTNTTSFSYPVGSLIPLGVTGQISQIDMAWLYFPYLVFCIAITAGLLLGIVRGFISNKYLAAVVALTTSCASTLYAYALWGGIKEVVLVPLILLSLINLTKFSRSKVIPTLIPLLAIYAVGGTSGLGFILGEIILFSIFRFIKRNQDRITKKIALLGLGMIFVVTALSPFIISFLNQYLIPEMPDSGNLARPLSLWQVLGIWPSGDFRSDIYWQPFSYLLLLVVALIACFGLWKSFALEKPILLVGVLTTLAIVIYSTLFSGIWLTGKAIAVASPFILLVTFFGIQNLIEIKRLRVVGIGVLALTIFGVSTSNYLGYRHTWLAPSEKVQELAKIGEEFSGQGPALLTDYAVLAARYFLRDLKAESASELRVNLVPMSDGQELKKGFSADIDLFDNKEISKYELLVLKHTATGSRPLFNYDLAYRGKYYDVWRKNQFGDENISRISLGNNYIPGETLTCKELRDKVKSSTGKVYAAVRQPNQVVSLDGGQLPKEWRGDEGNFGAVITNGSGYLQAVVETPETAEYEWFIGGSYPGKLRIFLDRKEVFNGRGFFEGNKFLGNYLFTGEVTAGKHLIEIRYSQPLLQPGAGVTESLGPLYLASETAADSAIISANQEELQNLCQKNLDWLAWVER